MASIRDLRQRIKSVGNIRQITRAMEMVASTKLRRFQERAVASRPYAREIAGVVGRLAAMLGDGVADRPLFREGAGQATALLVITSDRGLCGAYNSNLFRKLEDVIRAQGDRPIRFFVIGRKGYQYLSRRGREAQIERYLVEPPLEKMDYRGAARTAQVLTQAFLSGQYREVLMLYTAFESVVKYVPTVVQVLPIEPRALQAKDTGSKEAGSKGAGSKIASSHANDAAGKLEASKSDAAVGPDIILEPDPSTIFDQLVPRYLETRMYNALLESLTSEYASRRVSMKNATDAAKGMQNLLKSKYNRKRQETITKELLDIVGGAEALR